MQPGDHGSTARRAVVIQVEPAHEDVVESLRYSLVANGVDPVFVLSERSRARGDLFGAFTDYADDVHYVDFGSPESAALVEQLAAECDLVVFNTFQLNGHAHMARRLGKPTLGLVHNPRMFVSQPDCMAFARTGPLALVTLAPHVTSELISLEPTVFGDTATLGFWLFEIPPSRQLEPPTRTRVAVPGAVDFRNRDFAMLVDLVPRLQAEFGEDAFDILIPGGGPERSALQELVRERKLEDAVRFTDLDGEFVRSETLYPELARSSFLLPLLPDHRADYRRWKISTALATAVGFSIPPILDRWTAATYELPCVTYRAGEELAGLRRALMLDDKEVAELRAGLDEERRRQQAASVEEMAFALDRLFAPPTTDARDARLVDDFRGFLEFTRRLLPWSHSQRLQDAWVLWETGFRRDGYFVEFGAVDGVGQANGYLLERLGWDGIAGEPNPEYADRLRRNRTCYVTTKCVYDRTGDTVTFRAVTDRPALSTIASHADDDLHAARRSDYVEHEVETISLTDLLGEAGAPPVIDYLSIDTEGSELTILRAHDFDRYPIRCITVEHNEHQRAEIHEFLSGLGYRRKWPELSGHDDWYVLDGAYPDWSSTGREDLLEAVEHIEPFAGGYSERFNRLRGYFGSGQELPPMPAWGAVGPDPGPAAHLMARVLDQFAEVPEGAALRRRRAVLLFQAIANRNPVAALVAVGDRPAPQLRRLRSEVKITVERADLSRARLAARLPPDGDLAVWVDAADTRSTLLELSAAIRRARVIGVVADASNTDDGAWSAEATKNQLISRGFVPVARSNVGEGRVLQIFVPQTIARQRWIGRRVGRMLQPVPQPPIPARRTRIRRLAARLRLGGS